eukprot:scaffold285570_cov21-Tisochrysis_lutea.AAC.1
MGHSASSDTRHKYEETHTLMERTDGHHKGCQRGGASYFKFPLMQNRNGSTTPHTLHRPCLVST